MGRIVDADTHSLTLRLAGTFTPTKDLYDDAERASVIEAVPGAALILPSLGALPADGPSALSHRRSGISPTPARTCGCPEPVTS